MHRVVGASYVFSMIGLGWLRYHYYLMGWSYVGLLAATATEFMVRIVGWSAGVGTVVPTVVVTFLGGGLFQLRERRTLIKLGGGVPAP